MTETDPLDILLDGNGDLDLSSGDLAFAHGASGIAQSIRVRLGFFKGEWFLNEDAGVPWDQEILGRKPTDNRLNAIFRNEISATPGVLVVTSLSLTRDTSTRTLTVTFSAQSIFGAISEEIVL